MTAPSVICTHFTNFPKILFISAHSIQKVINKSDIITLQLLFYNTIFDVSIFLPLRLIFFHTKLTLLMILDNILQIFDLIWALFLDLRSCFLDCIFKTPIACDAKKRNFFNGLKKSMDSANYSSCYEYLMLHIIGISNVTNINIPDYWPLYVWRFFCHDYLSRIYEVFLICRIFWR